MNSGMTVLICSHTALPIDFFSGCILDSIPLVKGIWFQEGSLGLAFYAWGVPFWSTFGMVAFLWGAQAPFLSAIPSLWFKGGSALAPTSSGQSQMK